MKRKLTKIRFENIIKSNLTSLILCIALAFLTRDLFAESLSKNQIAESRDFMVVTSDPNATEAAKKILATGGTAADAAIAAQLVLGLTEPQASGLGGGAFVLYFNQSNEKISTFDARETAPSSATESLFLNSDGNPIDFFSASTSGKSIGIPGTPALIGILHDRFGSLPMDVLISSAYKLASEGFLKSDGLKKSISSQRNLLSENPSSKKYFLSSDLLINKEYAKNLISLAKNNYKIFYQHPISTEIIKMVKKNGGEIHQRDFDRYEVVEREPVCENIRGYKVCSMGEPSSGGLTMLQILKMIEYKPTWHRYIEASKLAFADRNLYHADPDFVDTPGTKLLDSEYIRVRQKIISSNEVIRDAQPGIPPGWQNELSLGHESLEEGTTHISIIDKYGNIISMTSTIETSFGSKIMSNGYLLNNELTDFSFIPSSNNLKVANRVQPNKRPRSSMTPTIVFESNTKKPVLVIGSAGGSRIIGHVTQRIFDVLFNKKNLADAIMHPHILSRGYDVETEAESSIADELIKRGHKINIMSLPSGINAIYIGKGSYLGVSDPRRIGTAAGN